MGVDKSRLASINRGAYMGVMKSPCPHTPHTLDALGNAANPPRHRLFVDEPLAVGAVVTLNQAQTHYLTHVVRIGIGGCVSLFNGDSGEYTATLTATAKKSVTVEILHQTRPPEPRPDLMLAFAPIKRIDSSTEKATEMGVGILQPIITEYSTVRRVNMARLRANATQAAEQTGRLNLPDIRPPIALKQLLADWPQHRHIIFCDEMLGSTATTNMANRIASLNAKKGGQSVAIFIGPEGGFSPTERQLLGDAGAIAVALGGNILRADTAVVAALAIWQALAGAWRNTDD